MKMSVLNLQLVFLCITVPLFPSRGTRPPVSKTMSSQKLLELVQNWQLLCEVLQQVSGLQLSSGSCFLYPSVELSVSDNI